MKEDGSIVATEAEVEKIFNALKPIKTSFLIGEWDPGDLDTGHVGYKGLKDLGWAGKDFRSDDDCDPIMVLDDAGKRVYNEEWGHSSVSLVFFSLSFFLIFSFYFIWPLVPLSTTKNSLQDRFRSAITNDNILVARNGVSRGDFGSYDLRHQTHHRPFPLCERGCRARGHGFSQIHGNREHLLFFPQQAQGKQLSCTVTASRGSEARGMRRHSYNVMSWKGLYLQWLGANPNAERTFDEKELGSIDKKIISLNRLGRPFASLPVFP